MKTTQALFADLTMALEDIHITAVEGQAPDTAPDMHEVLLASVRAGLNDAYLIVTRIAISIL